MNFHCIMQYGTKTYKTQRKGIAEVFGNFILLITSAPKMASCHGYSKKKKERKKKKKKEKQGNIFSSKLISSQCSISVPLENIRKPKSLVF